MLMTPLDLTIAISVQLIRIISAVQCGITQTCGTVDF